MESILCPDLSIYDPQLAHLSPQLKIEKAMQLEKSALDYDSNIKTIRKASLDESQTHIVLSQGEDTWMEFKRTNVTCSIQLMAGKGKEFQMGWEFAYSPFFHAIEAEKVSSLAARKAIQMLGAHRISSTQGPVILDNFCATQFLGIFMSSFLGEKVIKGKSLLGDKKSKQVLPSVLSIIDDGCYPQGAGSGPFDGEGHPSQKTILVENGVVNGFLFDAYWGKRAGEQSTGNACRAGLKSPPTVGVRNIFINPDKHAPSDFSEHLTRGMLITDVMGIHTADPVSGDFSVGISGFWIESGKKVHPVNGVVLSGNILDLFAKVLAVGADLRFFGPVGSPSLLIDNMMISGM
jgi:PmbA protein